MSTIIAIFEPDADGTLHLPLPEELRRGKVKVEAKIEAVESQPETSVESLRGKIRMASDFDEPLEDFKEYMG